MSKFLKLRWAQPSDYAGADMRGVPDCGVVMIRAVDDLNGVQRDLVVVDPTRQEGQPPTAPGHAEPTPHEVRTLIAYDGARPMVGPTTSSLDVALSWAEERLRDFARHESVAVTITVKPG